MEKLEIENFVHSPKLEELFRNQPESRDQIVAQVLNTENLGNRDAGLLRLAKLFYEVDRNTEKALALIADIKEEDERTRALVHLANLILKKEGVEEAKKIINLIENDPKGYTEYFGKY